jgi:zinc/manganese transport system substrate-binding protein
MNRVLLVIVVGLALVGNVFAKVEIAASLPDLASIAAYVGGDRVDVFSIARSTSDPHSVEVLPSYMVRVARADLYLKIGLSLDQWADQILDGARNSKIRVVDCSRGISVLEKPTGRVDASMGDVHPDGNPHYWLDPENGAIVAQTIAEALAVVDPAGRDTYQTNVQRFLAETAEKLAVWKALAASIPNRSLITYHSSWVYFAHAFGFDIVSRIEPIPGIPPSGSHLAELATVIRAKQIKAVLQELYFADDAANYLARETGVKILKLSPSCDAAEAASYFSHFERILNALKTAS